MNNFANIYGHIYSHNTITNILFFKMLLTYSALLFLTIDFCTSEPSDILEKIHLENPGFGTEWVWFTDENNIPHKVIIKPFGNETSFRDFKTLDLKKVNYWLYTRTNPNKVVISTNDDSLQQSTFDPKKDTKIITHGYLSSGNADTCQSIKNNFLTAYDANVFIFDWGTLADGLYPTVAFYPKQIGMFNADFIEVLVKEGADPARIHIVGHSLGAHLSGFTGKFAKSKGIKIGRITGLDPAGFLFFSSTENDRLDAGDADFVDVIHSCGPGFGIYKAIGMANFYPNGGSPIQPGCGTLMEVIHSCSHGRSWKFFAESIITEVPFMAYKCKSYEEFQSGSANCEEAVTMGDKLSTSARGYYYLATNEEAPFALGPDPKFDKLNKIH